jgi:MHS family alpha-ketoglutarate permease-like MFS transporter
MSADRNAGYLRDAPGGGAAPDRHDTRRRVFAIVGSSSGNLVEWYDFYVYSFTALYFAAEFFPKGDQTTQLLNAAGVFAAGFLMRPIGSWLFGRLADRRGRRFSMMVAVTLMCAGSLMVAVLPTYAQIGVAAPVLLLLARLVQGISVGGEYGTSATYMSEVALEGRRGFFSSFQYVTLVGGHVLAQLTLLIVLTAFDDKQVHEFGWRIGFAIGGVAAVVVFWLRRTMDESLSEETLAAVREGKDPGAGSMRELLTRYWRPLLLCFLITMGGTVAFYTYSVNAPTIVKTAYKSQAMTATWINLIGLIFLMLLQPVGGIISDKVGRKPLLLWFGFGGLVYTYVLITYLPETRSPIMSFLLVAVGYVILTGYTSINALVKSELFPAHVRALGVGVGYALANSIFGGTAPLIYQALKARDQVPLFIGYVTVCIAVSLVVYIFFLKNKSETYLDREQGAAFR